MVRSAFFSSEKPFGEASRRKPLLPRAHRPFTHAPYARERQGRNHGEVSQGACPAEDPARPPPRSRVARRAPNAGDAATRRAVAAMPAVAACASLGRRRASARRPWTRRTERPAGPPCRDAAVGARRRLRRRRRGDGRARSVDPHARGAAMAMFFPRSVRPEAALARRPRRDRRRATRASAHSTGFECAPALGRPPPARRRGRAPRGPPFSF